MIFSIGITHIISLRIILNRSSSSLLGYRLENIKQSQPSKWRRLTLNRRQMINYSFNDTQFFIFPGESPIVRAYLDVVRDTVCGLTLLTQEHVEEGNRNDIGPLNIDLRLKGLDWPLIGITMVGQRRLINIEWALRLVIAQNIPGDFIECGVWRVVAQSLLVLYSEH